MKNCVFNHNIITLTLPCSLLFLCRFYYPILAVNYYHLRAFVKRQSCLLIHLFPENIWGRRVWSFSFSRIVLQAPWGGQIQHFPKAVAKELLMALWGSELGTASLANAACLLVFENTYSLKGSMLSVSCLFSPPPPCSCKRAANQEKPK